MFRYLAVAWREADELGRTVASHHCAGMRAAPGWRTAFAADGIEVFVAGERAGANEAIPLGSDAGVVLGKLFRRSRSDPGTHDHHGPDEREQLKIRDTGGRALVDDHWGRYVAFLRDAQRRIFVIRDPSGALPCHLLEHDGVRVVFSWLEDVLVLLSSIPVPRVDWSALGAFIVVASISGRPTTLEGVTTILPGERLQLDGGATISELLWDAGRIAAHPHHGDPKEAAEAIREVVRSCVQAWSSCYPRLLLRLSGGLDSSIVLSCLAGTKSDVLCVNYHSPGSNSDERDYARLAALAHRTRLLEHERDETFALERVLNVARTPVPSMYLGRLGSTRADASLAARLGIDVLFTGGGGDQLFFEWRDWEPAADHLHVRGLGTGFLRSAMDAARLADLSVWRVMRLAWHARSGRPPFEPGPAKHLALAVRDALPDDSACRAVEHPALQEHLPPGKRIHLEQLLFPFDYYDPYELEAAPELVNPLLSQPAIELCLGIPTYVLTAGGYSRALTRHAFRNDLPGAIVDRHSKGGLEEHLLELLKNNLAFARSVMLDGHLVARGIVDRAKLETALSNRPTTLAAYTNEIHIYLAIEAWLQRMNGC